MRNYKVILVNLNSLPNLGFSPVFPVGANYVCSLLSEMGAEVDFIDFVQRPDLLETLDFLEKEFDCIAFSIRNLDSMELDGEYLVDYYLKITTFIIEQGRQRNPDVKILLGGSAFTAYPKGFAEVFPFDAAIDSDTEERLFQFITGHIEEMQDDQLAGIGGTCPERFAFEIKYQPELVKAYLALGAKQIGIPTRCGGRCPMQCIYCSYGLLDQNTHYTRPLNLLRNEIIQLYQIGVRELFFTDSLINISPEHARNLCLLLIELNLPELEWTAYARPTRNEEFLRLAALSGCKTLSVSFDTFSPAMLTNLKKGFSVHTISRFIALCAQYKVNLVGLLLFGGPGETELTIKETCEFANRFLEPGQLFFSFGIRISPGSGLETLLGQTGNELLIPHFLGFDERIFDFVLTHLDGRFISMNLLLKISKWRAAYKAMSCKQTAHPQLSMVCPEC
ncbi:B12-binding domain-containing radical SAM protein [Paenibacillus sp. FSL R7-0331]|uniref:B12-binding domain-containing radical SAM protein n=1 Tax=Paenibacillus sp. FSL R7-0331 TaxID=1536773 RepID=UPI0004F92D6F|nr:B12-binding domain-containing radical SAM protein [Paenibacillus sp. FSL R7-0331]AIQ52141.1 hypothetical protein R70331_11900 [Paenibacillus sp. FSL R7-0331]